MKFQIVNHKPQRPTIHWLIIIPRDPITSSEDDEGVYNHEVADLPPIYFRYIFFSETKPQMVKGDLNIGFQGLALIQGQIYSPESPPKSKVFRFHYHSQKVRQDP